MNLKNLFILLFLLVLSSHVIAKNEEKIFAANSYRSKENSAKLYEELDYQRAVQAYIWGIPLVNSVALDKALVKAGASSTVPSLLIFNHALTPKQIIMTASAELIYAFSVMDLARLGPVVVEAPPGVLGLIWDYWQRGLADIGQNPTEGSRFIILPPEAPEPEAKDYIVVRSRTNKVFVAGRGMLKPGDSPEPFVKKVSSIKIFPLAQKEHPKPTRIVLNDKHPFDSDWPKDQRYFQYLAEGLRKEVVQPEDKLMYGMLQPLGIEPGQPFKPDMRTQEILSDAAATGAAMVSNMAFANRFAQRRYWPDRQWEPILFVTRQDFITDEVLQVDQRAQGYYQLVGNGVSIYNNNSKDQAASWYVSSFRDKGGEFLSGSKTYRLRLEGPSPAQDFWSLTLYDNRSRSQIDTEQQKASVSSHSKFIQNPDGTIDLYFAPKPPQGMESNWIKTIPGQGFFAMFRIYGPTESVLNKTWKLNDIEEIKDKGTSRHSPDDRQFQTAMRSHYEP